MGRPHSPNSIAIHDHRDEPVKTHGPKTAADDVTVMPATDS
jgi:hypothetical protein